MSPNTGKNKSNLTASGKLSVSAASEELHQTQEDFLTGMKNAGYELPDTR